MLYNPTRTYSAASKRMKPPSLTLSIHAPISTVKKLNNNTNNNKINGWRTKHAVDVVSLKAEQDVVPERTNHAHRALHGKGRE